MTEPPQDDERRPEPGAQQPYGPPSPQYGRPQYGRPQYGPPAQQYGQPPSGERQQYGQPPYVQPEPQGFDRPYGPPAAPGPYGPDPYGTPFGRASAPPAQKSRVGLIAGGTLLIVLLIAAAVVAALTLGPRILNSEAMERDVAAQFEELNGVAIDLHCPNDMTLESGAEFTCTGTTEDGEEVELVIAVTDPPGDAEYTWAES